MSLGFDHGSLSRPLRAPTLAICCRCSLMWECSGAALRCDFCVTRSRCFHGGAEWLCLLYSLASYTYAHTLGRARSDSLAAAELGRGVERVLVRRELMVVLCSAGVLSMKAVLFGLGSSSGVAECRVGSALVGRAACRAGAVSSPWGRACLARPVGRPIPRVVGARGGPGWAEAEGEAVWRGRTPGGGARQGRGGRGARAMWRRRASFESAFNLA